MATTYAVQRQQGNANKSVQQGLDQFGNPIQPSPLDPANTNLAPPPSNAPLGTRGGNDVAVDQRGDKAVGQGQWVTDTVGGRAAPTPQADPGGFYQDPATANQPPATPTVDPTAPLAGPGYYEDLYKEHGKDLLNNKSASEDLYSKGAAGSNPFYDYAQQQVIKAINDSSAARGGFNSSYTMKNIGNAVADLRGQQAHELGQLAGQSDRGRMDRYNSSFNYGRTAQELMEGRARQSMDFERGLANDQADKVSGFYGEAGRESAAAQLAELELFLKEQGMDAARVQEIINLVGGGGGTAIKALA